MTPPPSDAGTATAGRLRSGAAPRAPRRVSGPAARRGPAGRPAAEPPGRLEQLVRGLPDARWLDRLLRGRAWIALVASALMGIVFMQVSLLKLNSGISRAVTAADTLERQNSQLRADLSSLDGEGRVQLVAAQSGLVLPGAGEVTYLDARRGSDARAVGGVRAPDDQRAALVAGQWGARQLGSGTPGASTAMGATAATGTTATAGAAATTTAAATAGTASAGAASAGTASTAGATSPSGTTGVSGPSGATSTTSGTSGTTGTTGTTGTIQPGGPAASSGTTAPAGTGALAAPTGG